MRSTRTTFPRTARRAIAEPLEDRILFAFGVTTTNTSYVVDTGADVKFTILRAGSTTSTIHLGDLTSITYKGSEMLAPYSSTSRYSHYEQGLSSVTTVSATVDPAGNWIKITCDDSNTTGGSGIIHYYLAKKGENNIYMASLPIDVHVGPGEGRFIAYLSKNVFTNLGLETPSDISANNGAVEGSDVFHEPSGLTESKFYNTRRMIENAYHGVTGSGVGAWMFMGNREHSAGGPFFKDIDFQTTSNATEIYNCLFTGHTQTEPFRQGLQGPYALQFTDGSLPTTPDYAWMENTGIQGWIPTSQRGTLTGAATGVPAGHEATVALSNPTAQ
jgi:rhamnogalacturonan endolyase